MIKLFRSASLTYYFPWILIAILYSPIFFDLYRFRWESIDYTHAYFILPVCLWIVWQKRQILKDLFLKFKPHQIDVLGLSSMILGLMMFIFGWRLGYTFIATLSLIPVLWGAARYLYGSALVQSLSFPILYLLFLIPPPLGVLDAVTLPMRYGISAATEKILHLFGYPIERAGLLLKMGGNEIFMGAPCSGFRSLITMLALSVAYVYFVKGNSQKKLILSASAIPLALFGNLLRVITLCLITFYAGKEAEEKFHYFSGGVIFLVMISCLMGLELLIDRAQHPKLHKGTS